MDSEKLLIGGVAIIAIVIAIPILAPMVSSKNQYDAVADSHKMQKLVDAINAYGEQNGQYPPSLYHLAPDYIDELPLTSTNLEFNYDPATGQIANPSAPRVVTEESESEPNPRRNRGGGGGVSPATDAMTGLSVSQELN